MIETETPCAQEPGHTVVLRRNPQYRLWYAVCSCGWQADERRGKRVADADGVSHVLTAPSELCGNCGGSGWMPDAGEDGPDASCGVCEGRRFV